MDNMVFRQDGEERDAASNQEETAFLGCVARYLVREKLINPQEQLIFLSLLKVSF